MIVALQTELETDTYEKSYDRLGGHSERWLIKGYKMFVMNVISVGWACWLWTLVCLGP